MNEQQPQIKTKETELSVVLVSWQCDKCLDGEMKPTGFTQPGAGPVQHLHRCGTCGHLASALETYPKLAYKPKESASAPKTAARRVARRRSK